MLEGSPAATQKRQTPTAGGERTGSHPCENPAAPAAAALPWPDPRPARAGPRHRAGRGTAGSRFWFLGWGAQAGASALCRERPRAPSGARKSESLWKPRAPAGAAGPGRGRSAGRGLPGRGCRAAPPPPAPGAAAFPSAPLGSDRERRRGRGASLACGGAPGAGNRGPGSGARCRQAPAGRRWQEQEEAGGANPSAPGVTVPSPERTGAAQL